MTKLILRHYMKKGDLNNVSVRAEIGKLSGGIGIFANILLSLLKLIIGVISSSVSIVADALNNFSDAASSLITLIGFKLTEKPADADHPYGHARYEYLSALAVSAVVFVIGFELGKSSVEKILNPTEVKLSLVSAVVLLVSIGVKLWLSHFNKVLGNATNSSALLATATDSRNDVIATSVVLLSAVIEHFTQFKIDGFMGLAVAIFILYSGVNLARETVSRLIGQGADTELKKLIVDYIESCPHVLGYHDLMVHDYGVGRRFASLHVEMDRRVDPLFCHELIDDMERECFDSHKVHLVIHYDPVETDNPEIDRLKNLVSSILKKKNENISIHDFRMVTGDTHTNLIFDMVLPEALQGEKDEIKKALEKELFEVEKKTYYTVVTFDLEHFN
ncbi:MAG: cation transporter [Ruminococcaceae bacterium]|nr:cation transporter [Oscillospiraceae bacterium]